MEVIVKSFEQLTNTQLYEILKARNAVFIVEQNCPYQDIDGADKNSYHIFIQNEDGSVAACLRIFEKDSNTAQLGRVVTTQRGKGLGAIILKAGVKACKEILGKNRIYIEAQTYATGFYAKEGFLAFGEEFLEDDIPHIRMMLEM